MNSFEEDPDKRRQKALENREKRKAKLPYVPRKEADVPFQIFERNERGEMVHQGDIGSLEFADIKRTKTMRINTRFGYAKKYQTPNDLVAAISEYVEWATNAPWYRKEAIKGGNMAGQIVSVPIDRPLSIRAMKIYLGMSNFSYNRYKSGEGYEEFHEVIEIAEEFMANHQIEGALVGIYNHNIAARLNKLAENIDKKVEQEITVVGMRIVENESTSEKDN